MNQVAKRLLAKCVDPSRTPYIAVLGPAGSGKTLLLKTLFQKLRKRQGVLPVFLSLRELALNSEVEMQAQLIGQLLQQLDEIDPAVADNLRDSKSSNLAQFLEQLCNLTSKRIVLFLDQFDSVPHFFSRHISRQLRLLYEKAASEKHLSRLGVFVAGVLSIFHIKRETDSAFAFFSTEALPSNPLSERISAIVDQLPRGLIIHAKALEWLAKYCGPDPAFLKGVLDELKNPAIGKGQISPRLLSQIAARKVFGHNVLREIALNVWRDSYLFEVVNELLENKAPVPLQEPIVDVSAFHLQGVVVVENDRYLFRNELIKKHAARILDVIRQCHSTITSRQLMRLKEKASETPGAHDIIILESLKRAFNEGNTIADVKGILRNIWSTLRAGEGPDLDIHSEVALPSSDLKTQSASHVALDAAIRLRRPGFGWDKSHVSICVPVKLANLNVFVTAEVARAELRADFSEWALAVWIYLLGELRMPIIAYTMLPLIAAEKTSDAQPFRSLGNAPSTPSTKKALKVLESVFIELAFSAGDPNDYMRDVVERAQMDRNMRIAALSNITGAPDAATRRLLHWAFETGRAHDDPSTPILQRLAMGIFDDLGMEQRRLLLSALLQLPACFNSTAELIASDLAVPLPAVASLVHADISSFDVPESDTQLQGFLRKPVEFLDVGLLNKALERSRTVCLITLADNTRFGSGVFMEKDLIITNYHVLETNGQIESAANAVSIQLGFTSGQAGVPCELHNAPIVASSRTAELDYVLLRLRSPRPDGLKLSSSFEYKPKSALHILQHPRGGSMKLSLSHNGLVEALPPAGKLRYVTTTAGGSSGAPCFDENWNLIAIHRAEKATGFGSVREGILLESILADAKL